MYLFIGSGATWSLCRSSLSIPVSPHSWHLAERTWMRDTRAYDDILLGKIDAMVDANAPSSRISSVIGKDLGTDALPTGLLLTSKQIKNLVNGRLGKDTREDRLRAMLDKIIQHGDNTCVIFEDAMGMTGAIFIQTEAQRCVFEGSGECLIMDFTHNNTLGYYLGTNQYAKQL
uniref:Serine protease family S01A putative n=1 Tax=Albugo laibachii Nc14 TaxID=890382 RepID=F0WAG6_9STRA|nr:serine protease family S01A putative [Albugo laibachii Nc14]|eukprot:CCA18137.1 serine protease family S01A putative [Albugo laibachii Nc14]